CGRGVAIEKNICSPLSSAGMASIDSSAPETTSDSSPTLSRRPLRGGWAAASWGRGQDTRTRRRGAWSAAAQGAVAGLLPAHRLPLTGPQYGRLRTLTHGGRRG